MHSNLRLSAVHAHVLTGGRRAQDVSTLEVLEGRVEVPESVGRHCGVELCLRAGFDPKGEGRDGVLRVGSGGHGFFWRTTFGLEQVKSGVSFQGGPVWSTASEGLRHEAR